MKTRGFKMAFLAGILSTISFVSFLSLKTYGQTVCDVYCESFPGLGCRVSYGESSYTCWHMEPKDGNTVPTPGPINP